MDGWTHYPPGAVVKDTEDSDSDNKYSFMNPLIHQEDPNNEEDGHSDSPSELPYLDPTREPVHPS